MNLLNTNQQNAKFVSVQSDLDGLLSNLSFIAPNLKSTFDEAFDFVVAQNAIDMIKEKKQLPDDLKKVANLLVLKYQNYLSLAVKEADLPEERKKENVYIDLLFQAVPLYTKLKEKNNLDGMRDVGLILQVNARVVDVLVRNQTIDEDQSKLLIYTENQIIDHYKKIVN